LYIKDNSIKKYLTKKLLTARRKVEFVLNATKESDKSIEDWGGS